MTRFVSKLFRTDKRNSRLLTVSIFVYIRVYSTSIIKHHQSNNSNFTALHSIYHSLIHKPTGVLSVFEPFHITFSANSQIWIIQPRIYADFILWNFNLEFWFHNHFNNHWMTKEGSGFRIFPMGLRPVRTRVRASFELRPVQGPVHN